MNRQQNTRLLGAALGLFVLLTPLQQPQASEITRNTKPQRAFTRSQESAGGTPVLSPEKRQKLHRLDPEDLFSGSKAKDARNADQNRFRQPNRRNRKRREERTGRNEEIEAAQMPAEATPAAPGPIESGSSNAAPSRAESAETAGTPESSPAAAHDPAAIPAMAAAVEPRGEQPSWLLPLVAACFLTVLAALFVVLGKLNKILRGSRT